MSTSDPGARGWVLYDGACGFCSRWIPFWAPTLRKLGLDVAPLQSDWVRERLALDERELVADLRLLLADGGQVRGADVYRYVLRRLWWAWPLYLLSIAPLSRRAFDWGYRTFARHRYRISHTCRLERPADGAGGCAPQRDGERNGHGRA